MKQPNNHHSLLITITFLILAAFISSCASTKEITYFNDIGDSALIASKAGLEPIIQKKDILSISVTSLSAAATAIFNMPNLPGAPSAGTGGGPITAGYLVSDDGTIKFPMLGNIPAVGLTQRQLEKKITDMLTEKGLLFDPIVTARFLNFRVTVLGEVSKPGVVFATNEQLSILEAIGQAGDLTIFGLRNNILLIRQEGPDKFLTRLDLTSSKLLQSPYFFLKSNDVIYVEPGKAKTIAIDRTQQLIPIIISGITLILTLITTLIK